jgi:phosphatidylinositol alpha-1,6-mannosyltransferase
MKTLFVTIEFPPKVGGVENYYGKIAQYWPDELIVLNNNQNELISPKMPFLAWLRAFKPISEALKKHSPQWLLVGEILPLGTVALLLSYIFKIRYGVILHGLDFSLATKGLLKRMVSKKILQKSSLVVCANSHTAEEVTNLFPALSNVNVVNPGVEINIPEISLEHVQAFKKRNKVEDSFVLLTVGRLVKRKGVDMVLAALSNVVLQIPDIVYIIIGDGPDKKYLENIIHQLGLDQNVVMLSGVSDEEKNYWLASSDVFIMPARNIDGDYEGFGIVYLEAGLFSKPVISGGSGGVGEAVETDVNGLVVNEQDPVSIAQSILRLYTDSNLRQQLGLAGRKRSLEQSWELQIKKFNSLLRDI